MSKADKKIIDLVEVEKNLRSYAEGQQLTEQEIQIGLRAVMWINAGSNSQQKLADATGVSASRLSPIFAGKYQGDTHSALADIAAFLVKLENEGEIAPLPFVETSMWTTVRKSIEAARFDKRPQFVFGQSQMGKTECLLHYQKMFPLSVKYYRFRAGMSHTDFILDMLKVWGIHDVPATKYKRREALYAKIQPGDTLILDEMQLALRLASRGSEAEKIIEEVRSIYDEKRIGLVMCGTLVTQGLLTTGAAAPLFAQLLRRCGKPVIFPSEMKLDDVRRFWEAAGLPEPAELAQKNALKAKIRAEGVTGFVALIQHARRLAVKRKVRLSWALYEEAREEAERLASGAVEE